MIQMETKRLILRNGSLTRPTPEVLQEDYKRYVLEHEDPSCSFEHYKDEVTFSFLYAQRGSEFGYFTMFPKEENKWIGHCNFFPRLCAPEITALLSPSEGSTNVYRSFEVEIGWAVSKFYRGKGYATETATALMEYGFRNLKVRRIVAFTSHDNPASIRVMEKVGMRLLNLPDNKGIMGVSESALL